VEKNGLSWETLPRERKTSAAALAQVNCKEERKFFERKDSAAA